MNKEQVTVQIEVEEYDKDFFRFGEYDYLINKKYCTVLVPPVEQQEGEVKTDKWCIKQSLDQRVCDWFNKEFGMMSSTTGGFIYMLSHPDVQDCHYSDEIPDGYTELFTVEEFFDKVGYNPAPECKGNCGMNYCDDNGCIDRKRSLVGDPILTAPTPKLIAKQPIGEIDGVKVYKGDTAYHVSFNDLQIVTIILSVDTELGELRNYSRSYLTPEAVNARLFQEVEKKACDISFTWNEYDEWYNNSNQENCEILDFCISKVEKQYSVTYLTINTESK